MYIEPTHTATNISFHTEATDAKLAKSSHSDFTKDQIVANKIWRFSSYTWSNWRQFYAMTPKRVANMNHPDNLGSVQLCSHTTLSRSGLSFLKFAHPISTQSQIYWLETCLCTEGYNEAAKNSAIKAAAAKRANITYVHIARYIILYM